MEYIIATIQGDLETVSILRLTRLDVQLELIKWNHQSIKKRRCRLI